MAFSFTQWHSLYTGDPSVDLMVDNSPKGGAKGAVQRMRQSGIFAAKRCPF